MFTSKEDFVKSRGKKKKKAKKDDKTKIYINPIKNIHMYPFSKMG